MSHYTSCGCLSGGYHGWAIRPYSGCCGAAMPVYSVPMPYSVMPLPGHSAWLMGNQSVAVPVEASADSTASNKKVFIGGTTAVRLTLEYMPDDGATAPSVTITVASDSSATSTWSETAITPGYHVKSDVMLLEPGSKVTLEVAEASARLRWCETVCC